MGFIYKITSPTGRIYIGKAMNLKHRISNYKYDTQRTDNLIMRSIRKYGWDKHSFEVVEEVNNNILAEREIYWIKKLNSCRFDNEMGMNLTYGGDTPSWMHDKNRREKQSKRYSGTGNPFYGKKHTKELMERRSKEVSEYNKKNGVCVPKWGAEKGWAKVMRPVIVYNELGMCVGEHKSITACAKNIGISIANAKDSVTYGSWVGGKYLVRRKTDNYPDRIVVGNIKMKTVRRPVVTLTPEYDVICEHPSALEASEFWGVPKTTINRAAMYNWLTPIRTGHVFIYRDLYDEIFKEVS